MDYVPNKIGTYLLAHCRAGCLVGWSAPYQHNGAFLPLKVTSKFIELARSCGYVVDTVKTLELVERVNLRCEH